jgi:hypothetical protein
MDHVSFLFAVTGANVAVPQLQQKLIRSLCSLPLDACGK